MLSIHPAPPPLFTHLPTTYTFYTYPRFLPPPPPLLYRLRYSTWADVKLVERMPNVEHYYFMGNAHSEGKANNGCLDLSRHSQLKQLVFDGDVEFGAKGEGILTIVLPPHAYPAGGSKKKRGGKKKGGKKKAKTVVGGAGGGAPHQPVQLVISCTPKLRAELNAAGVYPMSVAFESSEEQELQAFWPGWRRMRARIDAGNAEDERTYARKSLHCLREMCVARGIENTHNWSWDRARAELISSDERAAAAGGGAGGAQGREEKQ